MQMFMVVLTRLWRPRKGDLASAIVVPHNKQAMAKKVQPDLGMPSHHRVGGFNCNE